MNNVEKLFIVKQAALRGLRGGLKRYGELLSGSKYRALKRDYNYTKSPGAVSEVDFMVPTNRILSGVPHAGETIKLPWNNRFTDHLRNKLHSFSSPKHLMLNTSRYNRRLDGGVRDMINRLLDQAPSQHRRNMARQGLDKARLANREEGKMNAARLSTFAGVTGGGLLASAPYEIDWSDTGE